MTPILRTCLMALLVACGGSDGDSSAPGTGAPATGSPTVGDTWDGFARDFMATYCVSCHEESPKDFTAYADVVAWADKIRCGTTAVALDDCTGFPPPRQFPIGSGPMPTDEERDRMVAWIEAGTPE